MAYKYFFYSTEQMKFMKGIEEKMGRNYTVGQVIVNGTRKPFTELSSSPTSRYPDAKIVAQGEEIEFKYTLPGDRR